MDENYVRRMIGSYDQRPRAIDAHLERTILKGMSIQGVLMIAGGILLAIVGLIAHFVWDVSFIVALLGVGTCVVGFVAGKLQGAAEEKRDRNARANANLVLAAVVQAASSVYDGSEGLALVVFSLNPELRLNGNVLRQLAAGVRSLKGAPPAGAFSPTAWRMVNDDRSSGIHALEPNVAPPGTFIGVTHVRPRLLPEGKLTADWIFCLTPDYATELVHL
jgi:hypothetical protein